MLLYILICILLYNRLLNYKILITSVSDKLILNNFLSFFCFDKAYSGKINDTSPNLEIY